MRRNELQITAKGDGNFHKGIQLGDGFLAFQPGNAGLRKASRIRKLLLR